MIRAKQNNYEEIPMVIVDGALYYDTGYISDKLRCGMMDGEITLTVNKIETSNENDQSNFDVGYDYQYGVEDTIEINIDGK